MYDAIILAGAMATVVACFINIKDSYSNSIPSKKKQYGFIYSIKKFINRIFSTIGTVAIFIIVIEIVIIYVLAPKSNFISKIQEKFTRTIITSLEPVMISNVKKSKNVKNRDSLIKTKHFNLILANSTRVKDRILAKATIINRTSDILYIGFNKSKWPLLTDDELGIISHSNKCFGLSGVDGWNLKSDFDQIPPNQRLDFSMNFKPFPEDFPTNDRDIHITICLKVISKKVFRKITITPGVRMRYGYH